MKPLVLTMFSLAIASISTHALALTPAGEGLGAPQLAQPAAGKKKVIDKSCLMICEKWGENDCEKWVMKCKGDTGYPTGLLLKQ
jgi:hypothetical protein